MTSWDEIVAAATVGTAVRSPAALDGDPAAALLDAAAVLVARRRAGLVPEPVPPPRSATPAETTPELSPLAAQVLGRRLAARDTLIGTALLDATAEAGRRLPPPLLPLLLDAATRDPGLRAVAVQVSGRRGRWLAGHRPDWAWLVSSGLGTTDPRVWTTGSRTERTAHLAALRTIDPAAARALLTAGWTGETGDDRVTFLAALRDGLGPDDEPFLEAALDDRAAAVRATAAGLLAVLPTSGYAHRAAERARAALAVTGPALRAHPPAECTPAMERDGIVREPPAGSGLTARAWWLVQVLGRAGLATWPGDPARLAATAVTDGLGPEVHAGWRSAARREREPRWIAALLATPPRLDDRPSAFRSRVWLPDPELAAALPPAALAARVAHLLRTEPSGLRLAEVQACPRPWPPALADAALSLLTTAATRGEPVTPSVRELVRHAGAGLPAELADGIEALARRMPEQTTWPATLRSLAATLQIRRTFAAELMPPAVASESTPPAVASESTPPAVASESTPPAVASEWGRP